jgi:hypothetical protein
MQAWHLYHSGQFESAIKAFENSKAQIGKRVAAFQPAGIEGGMGRCLWHTDQVDFTREAFLQAFTKGALQPGGGKATEVSVPD